MMYCSCGAWKDADAIRQDEVDKDMGCEGLDATSGIEIDRARKCALCGGRGRHIHTTQDLR